MRTAPFDIEVRTFNLAVRIVRLTNFIPWNHSGTVIARQLARCGSSVGANVQEAQGAHSKADFIRRMNIARAESLEVVYWLKLLKESGLLPAKRMGLIIDEAEQVMRILTAIVKQSRKNANASANAK